MPRTGSPTVDTIIPEKVYTAGYTPFGTLGYTVAQVPFLLPFLAPFMVVSFPLWLATYGVQTVDAKATSILKRRMFH